MERAQWERWGTGKANGVGGEVLFACFNSMLLLPCLFACSLPFFWGGGGGGGMYCNVMLRTAMSRNCNAVQVNAKTWKEENKCLLPSTFAGFTLFFSSPPEAHVYLDTLLHLLWQRQMTGMQANVGATAMRDNSNHVLHMPQYPA